MSSPAETVFDSVFCFESYGVPVAVESNSPAILSLAEETVRKALLGKLEVCGVGTARHYFRIEEHDNGDCSIFQDGQRMVTDRPDGKFFRFLNSLVRILVAEFSETFIFVHSGVVVWKNKAILIPGDSFSGKTSLVAALIREGAVYYSDEYAVLDSAGRVHPFPRDLSIRNDSGTITETDVRPTDLGAAVGSIPANVGAVWFTKYDPGVCLFVPERQTVGNAIVEMINYTIPIRRNAALAMDVLRKTLDNCLAIKCRRGDVKEFVPFFLDFVDNTVI
jgi:hypothetical protein